MSSGKIAAVAAAMGMLTAPLQAAGRDEPPPEVGVSLQRLEDGRQHRAVLPGRLMSYALPRTSSGAREIYLLVEPESPARGDESKAEAPEVADGGHRSPALEAEPAHEAGESGSPRMLIRLERKGTGALTVISGELPPGAASLDAADLDGDGAEEILVFENGRISVVRQEKTGADNEIVLESLLEERRLTAGRMDPVVIRSGGAHRADHVAVSLLGALHLYAPAGEGGWSLASEVELVLDASMDEGGLRLTSPLVRPLESEIAERPLYATGPRETVGRRLHTLILDPLAEDEEKSRPVWSRLPAHEKVLESFFIRMDGRPVLLVTTRSAEKLSFFAEKKVRVYPLEPGDRSREGSPPMEAFDSGANLWQAIRPVVQDVDGDGLDDLVLAYWKGLKDDTVVLDAHLRRPGGKPPRGPVRTRFDVEDANRSVLSFGHDLDGDGLAELILDRSGETLIYRGARPGKRGHGLVEKKPRWVIPREGVSWQSPLDQIRSDSVEEIFNQISDGLGPPRVADLDGDGDLELLALRSSRKGRGRVWVTNLDD